MARKKKDLRVTRAEEVTRKPPRIKNGILKGGRLSFFVRASKPEDWQLQLADPNKQWKNGHSAKSLACCWMGAAGFPDSVKIAFKKSEYAIFNDITFLAGFVEYQVPLPGGGHPSQNDLLILAKNKKIWRSSLLRGKSQSLSAKP